LHLNETDVVDRRGVAMKLSYRTQIFAICLSSFCLQGFSQQPATAPDTGKILAELPPQNPSQSNPILLDVVVTDRSGKAVSGLPESDFMVRSNGNPQKILSFHAVGGVNATTELQSQTPVKIILMVDEVNTSFDRVAYERSQIKKYLSQNGGKLSQPLSLGFFSDTGTEIQNHPTQDGNALLAAFDQHET